MSVATFLSQMLPSPLQKGVLAHLSAPAGSGSLLYAALDIQEAERLFPKPSCSMLFPGNPARYLVHLYHLLQVHVAFIWEWEAQVSLRSIT